MKKPGTVKRLWAALILSFCFMTGFFMSGANAAPVKLLAVSLLGDDQATVVALDLSADTPFTAGVHEDRVEIDLPAALWAATGAQHSETASGLILSWRRQAATHGVKLILQTTTALKIDSSESEDTDTGKRLMIKLVRNEGILPIAPPVAVEELPVTTPGAAFGPPTPAQPVKSHKDCTAGTVQTGTLNGAPVYQFQDCK
jgi:hypothetical protein